jgi:hypothetical protein
MVTIQYSISQTLQDGSIYYMISISKQKQQKAYVSTPSHWPFSSRNDALDEHHVLFRNKLHRFALLQGCDGKHVGTNKKKKKWLGKSLAFPRHLRKLTMQNYGFQGPSTWIDRKSRDGSGPGEIEDMKQGSRRGWRLQSKPGRWWIYAFSTLSCLVQSPILL